MSEKKHFQTLSKQPWQSASSADLIMLVMETERVEHGHACICGECKQYDYIKAGERPKRIDTRRGRIQKPRKRVRSIPKCRTETEPVGPYNWREEIERMKKEYCGS